MPRAKTTGAVRKANPMLGGDDTDKKEVASTGAGETETKADDTAEVTGSGEKPAEAVDVSTAVDPTAEKNVAKSGKVERTAGTSRQMIERVVLPSERKLGRKNENVEAALGEDQRRFKNILENQEKFPIMIPLEPGEKKGDHCFKEGWVNGFYWKVPKGVLVNVPEEIFNILASSLQLTNDAGAHMLLSRSADVEDRLN